jgi:hypothetical protein
MVPLGTNKAGYDVYLYFQNCPKCNELLIAVKKVKLFAPMPSFNDTEGLILKNDQHFAGINKIIHSGH